MSKDWGEGEGVKPNNTPQDEMEPEERALLAQEEAYNRMPVTVVKIAGLEAQSVARSNFARLPADFLIINDLIFEDIPATAISIQSEADVFVAETLRTQSSTIEPKGRGTGLVSIQLIFDNKKEPLSKLKRLMAELMHNPFVFIENNKVRQTLAAPVLEDVENGAGINTETMAFVLHMGSLSISEQMPGVIVMDLQLAEFNYKPFSHHFWYSSKVHGLEVEVEGGIVKKKTDEKKEIRQNKIFPYELGFESYDFSEKAVESLAANTLEEMTSKMTRFGPLNTPVIFPMQSPAFLYYVQHLESLMPEIGEHNSDYMRFKYYEFDIKTPPPNARTDTSTLKSFFSASDYVLKEGNYSPGKGGKAARKLDLAKRVNPVYTRWGEPGNATQLITRMEALLTALGIDDPRVRVFLNALSGEASGWRKQKCWHYNAWGVQGGAYKNLNVPEGPARSSTPGGEWYGSWTGYWYVMPSQEKDKKTGLLYPTPYQPWRAFSSWKESSADCIKRISTSKLYAEAWKMMKDPSVSLSEVFQVLMDSGYATMGKKAGYFKKMVDKVEGILKKAYAQEEAAKKNKKEGPMTKAMKWAAEELGKQAMILDPYSGDPYARGKQKREQENNDQRPAANAPPDPDAQKPVEPTNEARAAWIAEQEDSGWSYYQDSDDRFKNLFYRIAWIDIGGDPTKTGSKLNIAPVAATVQFGHRLAKHKILGQQAPTWQFLGVGNKSGTIVLTAAGDLGRTAMQGIKTMYLTLQNNARNISLVRGSSSAKIEIYEPNSRDANNIFALTKIENIVISNISEESVVQDGVDVYRMTIEFMAQDFPESSFTPRNFISTATKKAMYATLIRDLQYVDKVPKGQAEFAARQFDRSSEFFKKAKLFYNHYHPLQGFFMTEEALHEEAEVRLKSLYELAGIMSLLEFRSKYHVVKPSEKIAYYDDDKKKYMPIGETGRPEWYIDLLFNLTYKIKAISSTFPILNMYTRNADYMTVTGSALEQNKRLEAQEKEQKYNEGWEEKLRKFGNDLGGVGDNLVLLIGGYGVKGPRGGLIRGYVIPDETMKGERLAWELWDALGMEMNSFVRQCFSQVKDREGFIAAFGETAYNDVVSSVISEFGTAYKDLNLPSVPGTQFPVVPEFYMYDDSLENAALTQATTGSDGLAQAIKRHVENQAKSNAKFISDRFYGSKTSDGAFLQVSKNGPQIAYGLLIGPGGKLETGYKSLLADETRFMGATGGFAGMDFAAGKNTAIEEALRTFDAVTYLLEEDQSAADASYTEMIDTYCNSALEEWTSKFGEDAKLEPTKAFLTAVVTTANLSQYTSSYNVVGGINDKKSLYGNLREYYYHTVFSDPFSKPRILRGPNVQSTIVDSKWNGEISPEVVADLGGLAPEQATPNSLIPPKTAEDVQNIQQNSCVTLSEEEREKIADQAAMEEDFAVPEPGGSVETPEMAEMDDMIAELAKLNTAEANLARAQVEAKQAVVGGDSFFSTETMRNASAMMRASRGGFYTEATRITDTQKQADIKREQLASQLGKVYDMFKDVNDRDKQASRVAQETIMRVKKDISLRRAYPTFKIFFIDSDSEAEGLSGFHAFDDFYSYSCVQEIRVTRSRKVAADLAVIRLTDVARKLTMGRFSNVEMDKEDLGEEDTMSWWAETLKENPFNGGIVQEGVKVQIRLGYSGNPDELETVFLGCITEISPSADGKILEIVCQGYGAELEAASMDNPEEELVYFSTQHALSAAIMQPFIQNFGHWTHNTFYNPAEIRNRFQNGGESPFELTFLQDAVRAESFKLLRLRNYRNNPEDDNIFAPPPWTYATAYDRWWNNAVAYRPLMATPWEVFKEHELRHPGYIAMALPFGHEPRMTMFFGTRGQNYWSRPAGTKEVALSRFWDLQIQRFGGRNIVNMAANDNFKKGLLVVKKNNPEFFQAFTRSLMPGNFQGLGYYIGGIFGRYRPFRNYHIFTSEHHIIQNEIRSSMANSFNAVEIKYSDDDDPLDADDVEEILEQIKSVKEGGGGVYTVQLNDNIPEHQVRTYEDSFPSCITEYMAKRYAQGLLVQGVKESYTGSLTVTGEETLKPYDIVMVRDHITDMYGPIEVEAVTHIFSRETGFVSVITPNMCVDANDWFAKGWMDTITHVLSLVYDLVEQQKNTNKYRKNWTSIGGTFDNFLATMAAFQVIHWDQTASPVCITPLMHAGRPLCSVTTAPKFAAVFSNIWGKWHQWWEDYRVGLELGGVAEEFSYLRDDFDCGILGWFDADPGGSRENK